MKTGKSVVDIYFAWIQSVLKHYFSQQNSFRLLQIGCGQGTLVYKLNREGILCYGLEKNMRVIERADAQVRDKLEHFAGNGVEKTRVVQAKGQFDLVFSIDYLTMLDDRVIKSLLSGCHRISQHQFHRLDINKATAIARPLEWWKGVAKELNIKASFATTATS